MGRLRCLLFGLVALLLLASEHARAQPPRLVVVVSVDQLCYHYLDDFRTGFAEDGFFARVEKGGATFTECHHRHAFTFTGPGHSVMLTGCYPNTNGIIGNEWFDVKTNKQLYCVECGESPLVGGEGMGISPRNLTAETLGDVLKTKTNGAGKVLGVSLKDRAGVLMTGKKADASYWFADGDWVTSQYYLEALPPYVRYLNSSNAARSFAGKTWDLLLDKSEYRFFRPDDYRYESETYGLGRAFPHKLTTADDKSYWKQMPATPFGNDLTLQLAKLLVVEEKLGADDVPDLLAVGFSSNDYIGHAYGPYSLEVQDVTYRTDRQLAELADFLDAEVGGGKWLMVVCADHGVAPIPEFVDGLSSQKRKRNPLGNLNQYRAPLEAKLIEHLGRPPEGKRYVLEVEPTQVFLSRDPQMLPLEKAAEARAFVRQVLAKHEAVFAAVTSDELKDAADADDPLLRQLKLAYNPDRSGDVLYVLRPYNIQSAAPATHGSPWPYDTHVPLLFLGAGIKPGKYNTPASPAQIAPTLARVWGVDPPQNCVEAPLPIAP